MLLVLDPWQQIDSPSQNPLCPIIQRLITVLRRLPEILSAASFIMANVTVIAKHWFCCFLSLLFCSLLCLLKSHSILLPLTCSFVVFPHYVGVNLSLSLNIFHLNCSVLKVYVSGNCYECVTVRKYCIFLLDCGQILNTDVRKLLNAEYWSRVHQ